MRLIIIVVVTSCLFSAGVTATPPEVDLLLDQVADLKIGRSGYLLGKPLSESQKKMAHRHRLKIDNPELFKFKDGNLNIIGLQENSRVLIMYESYDAISRKEIQDLVGNLFLEYGKPTVFSHDKVIYWAWNKKGFIASEVFETAKKNKKPPKVIATVKLNSTVEIMNVKSKKSSGDAYFIISSEPVLKVIDK